jgi:hypothetical protein
VPATLPLGNGRSLGRDEGLGIEGGDEVLPAALKVPGTASTRGEGTVKVRNDGKGGAKASRLGYQTEKKSVTSPLGDRWVEDRDEGREGVVKTW